MHRPTVHDLRSVRLPYRWRTLLAAAAVTAAVVPAAQAAAVIPAQARPDPPASTPAGPPPVTVLTQRAGNGNGDIFIAPFGDSTTYANGPEIISNAGQVLWFHPVPAGEEAADFRPQSYDGRPVPGPLTRSACAPARSSGNSAGSRVRSPFRPPQARPWTARTRYSPGSTTRRRSGTTSTRSSTTTRPVRPCCPTAGRSPCSSTRSPRWPPW
jgi:hypothetical protein